MNVSGQMIQLGNPQDRLLLPAMLQGFQQLWPLCAFFAGLNFHDFCEDCLLVTETSLDTEARYFPPASGLKHEHSQQTSHSRMSLMPPFFNFTLTCYRHNSVGIDDAFAPLYRPNTSVHSPYNQPESEQSSARMIRHSRDLWTPESKQRGREQTLGTIPG
jgi:hypothetical protein